jgi:hypothetical protein
MDKLTLAPDPAVISLDNIIDGKLFFLLCTGREPNPLRYDIISHSSSTPTDHMLITV